jgi:hypothetical protein
MSHLELGLVDLAPGSLIALPEGTPTVALPNGTVTLAAPCSGSCAKGVAAFMMARGGFGLTSLKMLGEVPCDY